MYYPTVFSFIDIFGIEKNFLNTSDYLCMGKILRDEVFGNSFFSEIVLNLIDIAQLS